MVKDAEAHASDDAERRSKVESRNQLDSLVYQVEKDSAEWGDKVSEESRTRLTEATEAAKEALKGDDLETINAARDELMQAFSAAGQEMYQSQAAEAEAAGEGEAGADAEGEGEVAEEATDEDVVEADYEIVEEDK
jgi:molecular chaperone DnaK